MSQSTSIGIGQAQLRNGQELCEPIGGCSAVSRHLAAMDTLDSTTVTVSCLQSDIGRLLFHTSGKTFTLFMLLS